MPANLPSALMHRDCFIGDHCGASDCPLAIADRKRDAARSRGAWSKLELRRDPGGPRHYLDGKPVHCGAGLELQAREYRSDEYGEYSVPVQKGATVRYEASWSGVFGELVATLHAMVAGEEFVAGYEGYMRFRWPKEG